VAISGSSLEFQPEVFLMTSEKEVPSGTATFIDEEGPLDCKCSLCTSFGLRGLVVERESAPLRGGLGGCG
jgi:hypothetical protein